MQSEGAFHLVARVGATVSRQTGTLKHQVSCWGTRPELDQLELEDSTVVTRMFAAE